MSLATLNEGASLALDAYIVDLAWAPDGSSIAVAGGEGAVVLVENVAVPPKARVLGEHGMGVIAVAWQPGGKTIASSGQDSAVALWDSVTGSAIKRVRPGTAWTEHIAFSPDGKLLATATGKALALWDSAGEKVHAFEPLAGDHRCDRVGQARPRSRGRDCRCRLRPSHRAAAVPDAQIRVACRVSHRRLQPERQSARERHAGRHRALLDARDGQGFADARLRLESDAHRVEREQPIPRDRIGRRSHRVGFRRQRPRRQRAAAS